MGNTTLDISLDPKQVAKSLRDIAKESADLAERIDKSLGKEAVQSVEKLEKKAENGTAKIQGFFRNLGNSVKEDLQAAFDFGKLLSGLSIAENFRDGVRQVYDMEKAFARLNARLQLSGKELREMKANVGLAAANAGQKVEDVLPGVEALVRKGDIKSSKEVEGVADLLSKSMAVTNEDLADEVADTLAIQNKKVNTTNIKELLDTIHGAYNQGNFGSATEVAAAIQSLSRNAQKNGLNTRELGGLVAMASKSGSTGQNILNQILEQGSQIGGKEKLNAIFGQKVFDKSGKLDASAIGKIDTKKFGQYSTQILEQATGISGASGEDLKRFIETFQGGLNNYRRVVNGWDETNRAFGVASDNWASKIDRFKQRVVSGVSTVGDALLHGEFKRAGGAVKEHAVDFAGAGLATILGGKALQTLGKGLFGKLGGTATGVATGKALNEFAGVTPVYVVNASEIGGSGVGIKDIVKTTGLGGGGTAAAASLLPAATSVLAKATVPTAIVSALWSESLNEGERAEDFIRNKKGMGVLAEGQGETPSLENMVDIVSQGIVKGMKESASDHPVTYTNPSSFPSTGRKF